MRDLYDADDARLIAEGDFATPVARYYDGLYRYIRSQLPWEHGHMAEDLANETVAQVMYRLHGKPLKLPVRALCFARASRVVQDFKIGEAIEGKNRHHDFDADRPSEIEDVSDENSDILAICWIGELLDAARVTGRDQEVFLLRAVDGLSSAQIAEQLGLKTGNVDRIFSIVCANLRATLEGEL